MSEKTVGLGIFVQFVQLPQNSKVKYGIFPPNTPKLLQLFDYHDLVKQNGKQRMCDLWLYILLLALEAVSLTALQTYLYHIRL